MCWKTAVALVAALSLLVAVLLTAPVVWVAIDESAVPPTSDAPSLPEGVRVAREEVLCGSGGCWRELTLSGVRVRSEAEVGDILDLADETCAPRSLIDRRKVCTWLDVVDGEVRVSLRFERAL